MLCGPLHLLPVHRERGCQPRVASQVAAPSLRLRHKRKKEPLRPRQHFFSSAGNGRHGLRLHRAGRRGARPVVLHAPQNQRPPRAVSYVSKPCRSLQTIRFLLAFVFLAVDSIICSFGAFLSTRRRRLSRASWPVRSGSSLAQGWLLLRSRGEGATLLSGITGPAGGKVSDHRRCLNLHHSIPPHLIL